MAVGYICDRCSNYFDWYETVYEDSTLNVPNNYPLIKAYREKTGFHPIGFSANALKFMFYEPVNENCSTNKGKLSGEIEECKEGNNDLIMLCKSCMSDFMNSLQNFWEGV